LPQGRAQRKRRAMISPRLASRIATIHKWLGLIVFASS
jgi:hypothetical protein